MYQGTALDIIESTAEPLTIKTYGKLFTFAKFIDLLVRYAKTSYGNESDESNNLVLAEMICLLLERMELSKGFQSFERKTYKPHTAKLTLLPSKSII